MTEESSRIEPLEPEAWNDRVRRVLGGTVAPVAELEGRSDGATARPLNILMTIAHHPALLEPFLGFAAALATRGVLPKRASELLALRAAWNCASAFEWGHHVIYARAAGIIEAEIHRVPAGPDRAPTAASAHATAVGAAAKQPGKSWFELIALGSIQGLLC